jgi:hypothetical protein
VDADGRIRDQHFGEGRYEQSEHRIQRLLDIERDPVTVEGAGAEAQADWDHLGTPETYLGHSRGGNGGGRIEDIRLNEWALGGAWRTEAERVVLEGAPGSIAFRFQARDAHLVMSPGGREPIPFHVTLDGEAPGASHGVDIDDGGNGLLEYGRMYQLVRQHNAVRERTLEITFDQPGAEAYSFTFG